jgi:glycosyltransferase involved in cell wall biosynthesis
MKPAAAIFANSFGAWSQTFIYQEVTRLKSVTPLVFCRKHQNKSQFPWHQVYEPPGFLAQLFYLNRCFWPGFDRQFEAHKPAFIHAHFGWNAVYALHYAKKFRLPLMVTFWGNDVSALLEPQRSTLARRRYVRRSPEIFERAEILLCVSETLAEHLRALSGRPERIFVHQHGVDTGFFSPPETRPTHTAPELLLVGRFVEKKGHVYAIEVLKKLHKSGLFAQLTFVGDGPLSSEIHQCVKAAGLESFVRFAGVMNPHQIRQLYHQSDILLAPSITAKDGDMEGSPTVVKEAGACGLPVVGFRHSGISETVLEGKTGFLCAEKDTDGLTDAITTLWKNPSLRKSMSEAAVAHIQRFHDLEKQTHKLETYYEKLLSLPR